ncbi:hypothetical protein HG535_0G05440 [Zygotorulaspora mrakii]|uniref:Proteasome assembly chaperone 2 n=1 Tax=Zygotorulaspora mrakii TaxID=42260 RepID=A0A7H9B7G1_ZYGMR|nr:uncharacterized protein HG535_0G05440 [Zygotorulaspora mrakii]QLG74661.1 hypothetical protein HG535_0G05440 [Zygotorulaspora mrakii]
MSKTLLIPLVSTGNVPQLTIDLVLHSLADEFQFVTSLDSTYIHPFTGPLDYVYEQQRPVLFTSSPDKRYSTGLELFYSDQSSLYVLQQRTPIIQGYVNNFIKEVIVPLVVEYNIREVVIVDSFGVLDEDVMATASVSFRTSSNFFSDGICEVRSVGDMIQRFQSGLHLNEESTNEISTSLFTFTANSVQQEISTNQQIFKFAYHLLNATAPNLESIKYSSVFVHEGDNSEDAHLFCDHLPEIIHSLTKISTLTPPISWKGVYGSRPIPASFVDGIYI